MMNNIFKKTVYAYSNSFAFYVPSKRPALGQSCSDTENGPARIPAERKEAPLPRFKLTTENKNYLLSWAMVTHI